VSAAEYEKPPILKAAELLPAGLLKGDHYEIEPRVVNDGFMNHFTIRSDFGTFEAKSRRMVEIRVHEVKGLADLKELSQTEVFVEALGAAGKKSLDAATKVVTDPVGTAKGVSAGVGRMFKRVSLKAGKAKDKAEDAAEGEGESQDATEAATGAGKELIGFNSAKRSLARRVGIDPYSSNEVLQKELDRLSWAAFAGEVGIGQTVGRIPLQGEITAVSDMVWNTPPADLEVANRKKLKGMGIPEEKVDAFYNTRWYTPTTQTGLVVLMEDLKGVEGHTLILELASAVGNAEQAALFLASLRMLRDYNSSVEPLAKIHAETVLPWGATGSGTLVVTPAVDHVVWTEQMADNVGTSWDYVQGDDSLKNVDLRIAGTFSARSKKELEALGWKVQEKALPPAKKK
jgi:hypothetical protein